MARCGRLLADAQWENIRPLLPKKPKRPHGGRPWVHDRPVLEGILWMLRSGARWQDQPEAFPSPTTCWRRLRDWEEQGVWLKIWRAFLAKLNERQQLKWSEAFLGGSFAPAKKGAWESAKPSGARGRSGGWWSRVRVLLWEATFTLRPPSEIRLVMATLAAIRNRAPAWGGPPPAKAGPPHRRPGL